INNLSQLSNLRVRSSSSVFRYKERAIDPLAVGQQLKVEAIVTGHLVSHGNKLTIYLELVDLRDNHQIWGEQYDLKLSDTLQVQAEIARRVSEKLRLRLTSEEQRRVTKHYT